MYEYKNNQQQRNSNNPYAPKNQNAQEMVDLDHPDDGRSAGSVANEYQLVDDGISSLSKNARMGFIRKVRSVQIRSTSYSQSSLCLQPSPLL